VGKRDGSVYQRSSDGRWVASATLGKDPKTGKRIRKELYADSEKEANILLNNLKYELQNNLYADPGKSTVESFFNEWHEIHKHKIEDNTAEYYRNMLDKHIIPGIGKIKLKDLKPMDIDKFYNELHVPPEPKADAKGKVPKKKKPLSWNSILKIHSIVHGALEYAKYNDKIKTNPSDYVKPPKKEKFAPKIMTEKDFERLITFVKGSFDEIPILLAACTGLRRSEVFGLRWRDIDFDNNVISITRATTRYKKYMTKKTKNQSSQRTFAVPAFVMDVLKEYRNSKKVVPEIVCDELKAGSWTPHYKKILAKLCIDTDIRFHDLRHFNAIIMMKYGVPDKIASGRLGHSQVSTTREIYQHVLPDLDKEAAEIINRVFNKAK